MMTDRSTQHNPHPYLRPFALMLAWTVLFFQADRAQCQTASLSLAGLRTVGDQGQFNGIQTDSAGNLYLLLDQHDGVRLLKTDPTATTVLAQAHIGANGDSGIALALDPSGNLYVTGSATSGTLAGTPRSAFPVAAVTSTSFVAKFDAGLNPLWLTFTGSDRMAATSVAATASGVFITGSIFSSTLPVTPSAILQAPSYGSLQNGFAEKFDPSGATLLYATYLTGGSGDTSPAGIAADADGNAYIIGYTTAPGYPTLNALVPNIIPNTSVATSGFLTKLTPAADGLAFSTFIPGTGLASIAIDQAAQNLLITGNVAIGQFPVATVQTPILPVPYQTLLRLPLDGSAVLSSTLLVPGTQSNVQPDSSDGAWVAGDLTLPILPAQSLHTLGDTYAAHINAQDAIDQVARFGGLPTINPTFASVPILFTALTTDVVGQPTFAGSLTPQASISLIPTETYDLPLVNGLSAVLPSTLRDAIPASGSCVLSLCPGSAAYLARLTNTAVPSLALSSDTAPNLTLRNLGAAPANSLNITATGFSLTTNCPSNLASGAECSIALSGSGTGAGTVTLQAANSTTRTVAIPAFSTAPASVVIAPRELDFGIQTSTSATTKRTLTITNLTAQAQTFTSKLDTTSRSLPYTVTEDSSDCTLTGPTTKLLAAGASCHITLALVASSTPTNDRLVSAEWLIGSQDVLLTGYTQAASLTLSAGEIDFGTQYTGATRLPRFLYLSNSSDTTVTHASVTGISPFAIQDRCPGQLQPHSVCQIQIDYRPTQTPGNDSTTLTLDQGLSALLTGQSLPQIGSTGATVNPNLTVSPSTVNFPSSVVVTSVSSTTQTVTIGNVGSAPFPLSLSLTGDFTETTNCPAILPANSTCTAVVAFTPSQPGGRQGLLGITAGANSSPAYVNLSGTGTQILPASNGTLDFGTVTVGQPTVQWFKISQSFRVLTAAASGDFTAVLEEDTGYGHGQPATSAFSSTASGTCFNCWLGLQFRPAATGARGGTLSLTSNSSGLPYSVNLTGTGLSALGLILTPATQDFGSVAINSTSATEIFTLTNLTSNSTPITAPAVTGDFALSPSTTGAACSGTLSAFASCFVEVAFSPTAAGQRSGTLTLHTGGSTVTSVLTGFGLPSAALSLSPASIVFRSVPGPTATAQTITLTNTGTATLQIATPTVTTANFVPSTTCTSLGAGATCTISVAFIAGNSIVTDALQIPTSAVISGSTVVTTYTVPLSGTYTAQTAGLQIAPAQADFGPNPIGTLGLTRQFTISNLTAKPLTLNISIPRQFALSGPPCAGLAPNASCSFSVTFIPVTNGDITGSLFAQAVPTDGSATLNAIGYVEGYGAGASTLAITEPLSSGNLLNFGQISSGQTLSKILTLTNKSGGANSPTLTIRRITTEWPFVSTSTCGQTLALNQSCTVTVTYAPLNQLATGTNSPLPSPDAGVLTLESDAVSSPDLIDLAGTAAPVLVIDPSDAASLLSYTASQNSLSFPDTAVGNISPPQTVTLANTGTSSLHLLSAITTSDFSVANPCSTIVPGASCDLQISYAPKSPGTSISAIEILTDSSSSLNFLSLVGAANPSLLTLAPAALDFGNVNLGTSSTLSLQITNTASSPAIFQNLIASGDYTASSGSCPASGGTLTPGAGCALQVSFAPSVTGTRTGVLSLATSISALPITANLTGVGAEAHLQISPATLDFGAVTVGASSIRSLALTNTGNVPVVGIAFAASSGDFAVTTPCSVAALNPGTTCGVTLTFTPTDAGTRTGTLTVTSSAASSPSLVPLTGIGQASGSFTLTTDQGSSSSSSVRSGEEATYNLILTPTGSYLGAIVLNCTPINPADYTSCSLSPSSVALGGTPQNVQAALQTIASVKLSRNMPNVSRATFGAVLAFLTPALFGLRRWSRLMRGRLAVLWTACLAVAALCTLLTASGCGAGGDPSVRYSTPGTYQYRVTASSTSGVSITRSVTLNLTIQGR